MKGSCFGLRVKNNVKMNTSLCETYRDAPLQLHHITPIDFHSIVTLPDSHRWPALEDLEPCKEPIPLIDLKSIHVVDMLGNACRKWGIFQLTGHDVPFGLLEDVEFHATRLFDLPSHIKIKALRSPDGGNGRMGTGWLEFPSFLKSSCGMKGSLSWNHLLQTTLKFFGRGTMLNFGLYAIMIHGWNSI